MKRNLNYSVKIINHQSYECVRVVVLHLANTYKVVILVKLKMLEDNASSLFSFRCLLSSSKISLSELQTFLILFIQETLLYTCIKSKIEQMRGKTL